MNAFFNRFESIIHEFDPWFNYRSTAYMVRTTFSVFEKKEILNRLTSQVEHGFYDFLNWFDSRAWYPLGRL